LLPATKGKKLPARPIYFESLYPYYSRGWAPLRGIIQDQRKYIDSPVPELYDLAEDFNELRNLAGRLNLDRYRKSLKNVMDEQSAAGESDSRRPADSETLRKLRSLGYISGQGALKETFGPKDDVKALLPYHNRSMEARALFREGKADAAVDMLKAVIAERDDIDVAYSNLATLYKEQGRPEEAIQVLKDGLSNLPSNYTIFSTYVNFLVAAGRFTEILEAVSKTSIRQMDYDPEIWNHLGIAYANTGESEKALSAFEKSLALDDQFASTYVNRGTLFLSMFLRSGNSDMAQKAAADYTKAAALDPDSSAALNGLGVVSRLTGDPDSAIRYLRKALEAKPGYGDALYNLGMAYLDKKDYSRALEVFQDYRKKYGSVLPQADMKRLDDLIRECRRRI
jgi:tetratricopeptide (TPR) repeat protein